MLEATEAASTEGDDGTYEMRELMLSQSNPRTLRPSNEMSPDTNGTILSSAKHRLVLPAPRSPTTARRLPGWTLNVTLERDATEGTGGWEGGAEVKEGGGA